MDSSPVNWDRVKEIFADAQELDPEARTAFVHEACAGDSALEAEVRRLLDLDREAQADRSFLPTPPGHGDPRADQSDTLFKTGDFLAGRFHVVSLIGRGGMAEVYEARDDMLRTVVALKVAKPDQESLERVEARWRRELLLSRKVTHRGVCRVYDVARHCAESGEPSLLLIMERVYGEALGARLQESRLTVDEAIAITNQIADALDAAHRHGVLHRDVKPDNILLEPQADGSLRAVLTDFGIARPTSDVFNETITRKGDIPGTPAYMAPELFRGIPASVQSDLYAFGMVVRDMVAATMPTRPMELEPVFARAIHHEPSARHSSAREFVADVTAALSSKPLRLTRRHVLAAIPVAVIGGVAAYRYFAVRSEEPGPKVPVSSPVLLPSVKNETSDSDLDGLTEVLRSQLAQSRQFELVDATRIREALMQMRRPTKSSLTADETRTIALREGAPLIIFATVNQGDRSFHFDVTLELVSNRQSGTGSWTRSFTARAKQDLFDIVHEAAVWIRKSAGEDDSRLREQNRRPSETTTLSWVALGLLSQADALAANGNHSDAALLFGQAEKVDPEFAVAQMRLGDSLIILKRDKEGYAAWQRAIASLEKHQFTSRETHRIRAQYFDDTGDLKKAEEAYRTFTLHYPEDFYAQFLRGSVLSELDRVSESIEWFKKAHTTRPGSVPAAVHLAAAYLDTGSTVEAGFLVRQLAAMGANEWAVWLRALTLFTAKRVADAMREFEPMRTSTDKYWRSRAYTIRAAWLSELGRDDHALEELEAGITYDSDTGLRDRMADKWLHRATLEQRAGNAGAVVSARRALSIGSSARRIAMAAGIAVKSGDLGAARRLAALLDDYPQVPATETARQYLLGQLYTGEGSHAKALETLEDWTARARRPEDRMPLVHALLASGDKSGAERLLREMVQHPVAIYARPEPQAPGLWREALIEFERVLAARSPEAAAKLRGEHAFIWPEGESQGAQ